MVLRGFDGSGPGNTIRTKSEISVWMSGDPLGMQSAGVGLAGTARVEISVWCLETQSRGEISDRN